MLGTRAAVILEDDATYYPAGAPTCSNNSPAKTAFAAAIGQTITSPAQNIAAKSRQNNDHCQAKRIQRRK